MHKTADFWRLAFRMHIVVTGYGPFCSKAEDKDRDTQFDVNPSWAGLQKLYYHIFMLCIGSLFNEPFFGKQ